MDDTYFSIKNTNKRKYAGTAKRKGSTLRKAKNLGSHCKGGSARVNFVTKVIRGSEKWNSRDLQQFGTDIIGDGGMLHTVRDTEKAMECDNNAFVLEYSLNKKKRWLLPKKVEQAMSHQVTNKDDYEPDLTVVHRSIDKPRNKKKMDVVSAATSKVVKRSAGKKAKVACKENPREIIKKNARKSFSRASDLLDCSDKENSVINSEILYEFVSSPSFNDANDYPRYNKSTKLRGQGKGKSRRYLECDHRSIQSHIQAFQDRKLFQKKMAEQAEKALLKKAKSESMSSHTGDGASVESLSCDDNLDMAPINLVPHKGRVVWEMLDNDVSIIAPTAVATPTVTPSKINEKFDDDKFIDAMVSRKSLTELADGQSAMAAYVTVGNTSPPRTVVDVAQALRDDCGLLDSQLYIIVKHLRENNDLSVVSTSADLQVKLQVTSENKNLQEQCVKYLQKSFAAAATDFHSVHEIDDVIRDLFKFVKTTYMRPTIDPIRFNNPYIELKKVSSLQQLLGEFGLHHKTLTRAEVGKMISQNLHSANEVDEEALDEFEDDDFVHIVPPPLKCGICNADLSSFDEGHLALSPCFHWFCEPCWTNHARATLGAQLEGVVECPEPQCHSVANEATVMSILPESDYWEFKRKQVELFVGKNKNLTCCPREPCGKICKIYSKNDQILGYNRRSNLLTTMICSCNASWCALCGREAHWPSSCAAFEKFSSQIIKHMNDGASAEVIPCPECRLPVALDKGSAQVICQCGCKFCLFCKGGCSGDHVAIYGCDVAATTETDFNKAVEYRAKISSDTYSQILERRLAYLAKRISLKPDDTAFATRNELNEWMDGLDGCGGSKSFENHYKRFVHCSIVMKEIQHTMQFLHVLLSYKRPYNRRQRMDIEQMTKHVAKMAATLEANLMFRDCGRGEIKILEECEEVASQWKNIVSRVNKIIS